MPKGVYKHKKLSEEHKRKIGKANKGHSVSEEARKKISEARLGKKLSKEHREKLSEAHKGVISGMKGKHRSEEIKKRLSEMNKGKHFSQKTEFKKGQNSKEKHPNWKGGKSFELYGFNFTEKLKTSIRKRDKFTCQICKNNGFDVHHIDYNKKNCDPNNLITLCRSCHMKTNFHREYWKKFFSGGIDKIMKIIK